MCLRMYFPRNAQSHSSTCLHPICHNVIVLQPHLSEVLLSEGPGRLARLLLLDGADGLPARSLGPHYILVRDRQQRPLLDGQLHPHLSDCTRRLRARGGGNALSHCGLPHGCTASTGRGELDVWRGGEGGWQVCRSEGGKDRRGLLVLQRE